MKIETTMFGPRRAAVAAAALLTFATAGPALAGQPVRSMVALQARVRPGTVVDVADQEGRAFRGNFVRADHEGVLVSVPGVGSGRRVAADEVTTVTRVGDSLRRGILIGAGVGVLLAIPVITTPKVDRITCYEGYCRPWCVSDACNAGVAALGVAISTAVGAVLDHRVTGREVVYEAGDRREPIAFSVVPYPVRRGGAVRVAVKF